MTHRLSTWLLVGALACAVCACTHPADGTAVATQDTPLHLHVVCLAAGDPACPATDRAEAFDRWAGEVLYRPESSFSVRLVGALRNASASVFSVCVPRHWGQGDSVLSQKRRFVSSNRALAAAPELSVVPDNAQLQGCRTPDARVTGEHQVVLIAPELDPMVIRGLSDIGTNQREPLHFAVVCDRSDSGFGAVCDTDALRRAYDAWLGTGTGNVAGSSWTVHLVAKATEAPQRIFQVVVPGHLNPGARVAYLLAARGELSDAIPTKDTHNASAITAALKVATAELHENVGRYSLIVLSDLREVDSTYNLEQKAPKVDEFAQFLDKSALRADLHNTPVFACGLHDQGGSQGTHNPKLGEQVRELWSAIFHAQGAPQVELRPGCDPTLLAQVLAAAKASMQVAQRQDAASEGE